MEIITEGRDKISPENPRITQHLGTLENLDRLPEPFAIKTIIRAQRERNMSSLIMIRSNDNINVSHFSFRYNKLSIQQFLLLLPAVLSSSPPSPVTREEKSGAASPPLMFLVDAMRCCFHGSEEFSAHIVRAISIHNPFLGATHDDERFFHHLWWLRWFAR